MKSLDDDEFWSVAMNGRDEHLILQDDSDDFDVTSCETIVRTITTLAPHPSDSNLVLRLGLNSKDGCLSDVSGDIWDASLLLAAFLYGTKEGRKICYNACFGKDSAQVNGGGILELGSGLGLSGMAAAAAALHSTRNVDDERTSRVVLTDLDDSNILSLLSKNVESNLNEIGHENNLSITVQSCNWSHVANSRGNADNQRCCPNGTFNLIIGSALIYVPEHAVACAETISHYLCRSCSRKANSQAIVIQLPDRAGFDTFLRRCRELDMLITSRAISEDVISRVEQKLVSANEYRMYFITPQNNS